MTYGSSLPHIALMVKKGRRELAYKIFEKKFVERM
jgi:hypothetical protein